MSTAEGTGTTRDERLDRMFRALGDKTRRTILSRLAESSANVSELAKPFDMSLAAVGKHLRVLERAGLVRRDIDGRVHNCSLSARPLRDADEWLNRYRRFWDETLEALSNHFDEP